MAEPDRTNADAERVSAIVAKLRAWEVGLGSPLHRTYAVQGICEAAADIIEAQSKALAEAREALKPFQQILVYSFEDEPETIYVTYDGETLAKLDLDSAEGTAALKLEQELAALRALTPTPENPNG